MPDIQYNCKIKSHEKNKIKKENLIDMSTLSYLVLSVCKQSMSQCVGFTPLRQKFCFVDSNFLQNNNDKSNCEPFLFSWCIHSKVNLRE